MSKSLEDAILKEEKYCIEDAIKATGEFSFWLIFSFSNSNAKFLIQGHGKFHLCLLIVCGLGLMCVVVENVNIGFVLPYVRCEMNISTTEQGFLNSVGYIGIVLRWFRFTFTFEEVKFFYLLNYLLLVHIYGAF